MQNKQELTVYRHATRFAPAGAEHADDYWRVKGVGLSDFVPDGGAFAATKIFAQSAFFFLGVCAGRNGPEPARCGQTAAAA